MERHLIKTLAIILAFILASCKTTHTVTEVPVVVEHTTHEKSTELRVDTVYHRDSTIVMVMGDTLIERHYNTIYKVREIAKTDTLHDTIPKVVTVTKTEVKKTHEITWWQKLLLASSAIVIIAYVFHLFIRKVY